MGRTGPVYCERLSTLISAKHHRFINTLSGRLGWPGATPIAFPAMATVPTAAYSIGMRIVLDNVPGTLGRFAVAVGEAGGNIAGATGFEAKGPSVSRLVDVHARDEAHSRRIVETVEALDGVTVIEWWDRTYRLHEGGKIEVLPLCSVGDAHDLAMAYTPGVARVCMSIHEDTALAHEYTIKKNTVAIVSDGTAVLGLGDIGPEAAMPVMEGKALLFKEFAGVDAFPICLDTKDPDEIIETVQRLAPTFGGINLEDIAAPNCFLIEDALKESLDIPVFHDDQHGTAVVTLAGLMNAVKLVDKKLEDCSIVISGMGAAGLAIGKILRDAGVDNIVGVDRMGAVHKGRDNLNFAQGVVCRPHQPRPQGRNAPRGHAGERHLHRRVGPPISSMPPTSAKWPRTRSCSLWQTPDPEIRPRDRRRSRRRHGYRPKRFRQIRSTTCLRSLAFFGGRSM